MPRLLCLAKAAPSKRSRGKRAERPQEPRRLYGILEQVPVYLQANVPIWNALRQHAKHQLIIDEEHPEEAFAADVLPLGTLTDGALDDIEHALSQRRAHVLKSEQALQEKGLLSKEWDKLFDQEKEWLAIRGLIASAIPRGAAAIKRAKNRALLLIKA